MKTLLIIDGNALIHRAYHALPPLTTKKGEMINAAYGFTSILLRIWQELSPDFIICAFDLAGPTFRDIKYEKYKAKRVKQPQELYDQIPRIKQIVKILNIPIYEKQGYEADDIIGTLVFKAGSYGLELKTFIVTGDLDALQLVDRDKTVVYMLKKGIKDIVIYDEQAVIRRYKLKPSQIVDLKALKGDSSDNIPGVSGIGEKTAIELLQKFGSLEKLYQNIEQANLNLKLKARLLEYRDDAFLSQDLAAIRRNAPIAFSLNGLRPGKCNREEVIKLFEELEFYSLIKKLECLNLS